MSVFTSESVTEGHPDKVCDYIADSILDAHLGQDPASHVACEVLCKDGHVVLAGEITSRATVDAAAVARNAIRDVGYSEGLFHPDRVVIHNFLGEQSRNIRDGITRNGSIAAGDQGLVFGFATRETPELLPLPIVLAHRITRALADARKSHAVPWLRPDGKSQVTVRYEGRRPIEVSDVVVSTQHAPEATAEEIRTFVEDHLLPAALGEWWHDGIRRHVNPAGEFTIGGPEGDCGVTGRKIIVDTYGGYARHGGGAFSGKDPTKVDRSAAYFARFVARRIVLRGLAECAEVQLAYAIGIPEPVSVRVDTHGTGDPAIAEAFARQFDFHPAAIIERLDLRKPVYRGTTNYGHFGKSWLTWEQ